MHSIIEKLKNTMNTFTANVIDIHKRNQQNITVYSSEFLSKKVGEEITVERRKALDVCVGLKSEFISWVKIAKTKLFEVKYPNAKNEATRTASELQLSQSKTLLSNKPDLSAVLRELELAYEIGRVDFVSATLDAIKAGELYPNDIRLEEFEIRFNEKFGIAKLQDEYLQFIRHQKLLAAFVDELLAGDDYTPYPIEPSELTDEQYFANRDLAAKSSVYWQKMSA